MATRAFAIGHATVIKRQRRRHSIAQEHWSGDALGANVACRGLRDLCHNVGPVFLEPGHGFGAIDDALEGFPGWVLEGFELQSLRRVLDEVMQAFVSSSALEGICNRCAGPSSLIVAAPAAAFWRPLS